MVYSTKHLIAAFWCCPFWGSLVACKKEKTPIPTQQPTQASTVTAAEGTTEPETSAAQTTEPPAPFTPTAFYGGREGKESLAPNQVFNSDFSEHLQFNLNMELQTQYYYYEDGTYAASATPLNENEYRRFLCMALEDYCEWMARIDGKSLSDYDRMVIGMQSGELCDELFETVRNGYTGTYTVDRKKFTIRLTENRTMKVTLCRAIR